MANKKWGHNEVNLKKSNNIINVYDQIMVSMVITMYIMIWLKISFKSCHIFNVEIL